MHPGDEGFGVGGSLTRLTRRMYGTYARPRLGVTINTTHALRLAHRIHVWH